MFFDTWGDLGRVAAMGVTAYIALVACLGISGKRTLAKLNAFDLVVTVALGSTLATIALSSEVSAAEGALAIVVLIAAQLVVAVTSVRWPAFRRFVTSEPTSVFTSAGFRHDVLRRARLTESEVRQAIRSSGLGDLARVGAVVLETDGSLSVIPAEALGDGSALVDVPSR